MLPEDPDTATFRRLTLRDDRRVTVRAIFPEDKTILDQAFERLCKEAFYTRFLSDVCDVPKRNSPPLCIWSWWARGGIGCHHRHWTVGSHGRWCSLRDRCFGRHGRISVTVADA